MDESYKVPRKPQNISLATNHIYELSGRLFSTERDLKYVILESDVDS